MLPLPTIDVTGGVTRQDSAALAPVIVECRITAGISSFLDATTLPADEEKKQRLIDECEQRNREMLYESVHGQLLGELMGRVRTIRSLLRNEAAAPVTRLTGAETRLGALEAELSTAIKAIRNRYQRKPMSQAIPADEIEGAPV